MGPKKLETMVFFDYLAYQMLDLCRQDEFIDPSLRVDVEYES